MPLSLRPHNRATNEAATNAALIDEAVNPDGVSVAAELAQHAGAAERPSGPSDKGILASVGTAALIKIGVMALSGVLGVLTSRLIIGSYGVGAYAQYGLLTTIPSLLPFADLGIASVVLNTISASHSPSKDLAVRRIITTAFRVLLLSGAIIGVVGVVISLLGAWPILLGQAVTQNGGELSALLCVLVFGLVLPLTVSQRVMVGLRKTTVQVTAQAVVAPFMLLCVGTCALLVIPAGNFLPVFSYIANSLVSVICLIVAARMLSPQFRLAIRDIPRLRAVPNAAFFGLAWPSLAQMLAIPVALQTDRLLLSHLSGSDQLSQYNLAAQLFGLILQTITAAGVSLWPIFARARADRDLRSPARLVFAFLAVGLVMATTLAVLSPWVAGFVSSGKIHLDWWILGGFIAFVATQAVNYPLGIYMTDKRGLRFQVAPILAMVPINLGLSWLLIGAVGAGGTIIASAFSVALCQILPNALYVRRDLRRARREQ